MTEAPGPVLDRAPGVRVATARPTRAIVLTITSRMALAGIIALVGAAAWSALSPTSAVSDAQGVASSSLRSVVADADASDDAVSMSGLVDGIEAAVASASGQLVSLEVGRPDDRSVAVRIVVDVPGRPDAVAQVLAALEGWGVIAASVDAVVATSDGARTDVTGRVLLSDRRIAPASGSERQGPLAVELTDDVARAGVRLRRLDVEERDGPVVRLEVDGSVDRIVAVLSVIEGRYSAPTRFLSVATRQIDERTRAVAVVFRPRQALG